MSPNASKPKTTWGRFLDYAPDFDNLMFNLDDSPWHAEDADPIWRAVGFFNWFHGEVGNGGLAQFFSNGEDSPLLKQVPGAIRKHPLLQDVADLVDEAYRRPELAAAYRNSPAHEDFNRRAEPINAAARRRILFDIICNPSGYLQIELPPNLRGEGIEYVDVESKFGTWRARFVEGFPIGPNTREDEHGRVCIVRFSSTRQHLDYDVHVGPDVERHWIDFTTGLCGARNLRSGKLNLITTELDGDGYYSADRFDDEGRSTYTQLRIKGVSLQMANRYLPHATFEFGRFARTGANFRRYYFADGQLNAEMASDGFGGHLWVCFDQRGKDLAPGGTGELKLLVKTDASGDHWRYARLLDGYLDGHLVQLKPDGSVAYEQVWKRGKLVPDKPSRH